MFHPLITGLGSQTTRALPQVPSKSHPTNITKNTFLALIPEVLGALCQEWHEDQICIDFKIRHPAAIARPSTPD